LPVNSNINNVSFNVNKYNFRTTKTKNRKALIKLKVNKAFYLIYNIINSAIIKSNYLIKILNEIAFKLDFKYKKKFNDNKIKKNIEITIIVSN